LKRVCLPTVNVDGEVLKLGWVGTGLDGLEVDLMSIQPWVDLVEGRDQWIEWDGLGWGPCRCDWLEVGLVDVGTSGDWVETINGDDGG